MVVQHATTSKRNSHGELSSFNIKNQDIFKDKLDQRIADDKRELHEAYEERQKYIADLKKFYAKRAK